MKLLRTDIKNYRSIENLQISYLHGCQILLGINESGKSNILRALQLLDPDISTSPNDLRIERQTEQPVTEGLVRFIFQFDDKELEEIFTAVKTSFLVDSLSLPLIKTGDKTLTLKQFVWTKNEGIYRIDLPSGARIFSYWATSSTTNALVEGWRKKKNTEQLQLVKKDNTSIAVSGQSVLQTEAFKAIDALLFEPVTLGALDALIGAEIVRLVKQKLPKCIYWRYSEQFLLPSSINVAAFEANPDSCLPLKSMFELAGVKPDQVGAVLSAARLQPAHRYLNLLDKVAKAATKHLHEIWSEHKGAKIELRSHGEELIPVIQDQQIPLDMANRSDGFKRFVSFLLLVSAKVRTAQLADHLILVDEPEIGLHPRGARNLMHELIEIGDSNTVVYSTHSIFMVDKENIERHVIVEKKDEITTTWRASKSRIQDEEVLYSAIGYSIFETLQHKNVIFEGWKDKQIFRIAKDVVSKESKPVKTALQDLGLTFAEGVKDVRHVARFLELANRGCLIISDADSAGRQWQREYQRENGWGTWLTLQDILGQGSVVTAEDLLQREALIKRANAFRKDHQALQELKIERFGVGAPVYPVLVAWLREIAVDDKMLKDLEKQLKDVLFNKLKKDEISDDAKKVVQFVADHIFVV